MRRLSLVIITSHYVAISQRRLKVASFGITILSLSPTFAVPNKCFPFFISVMTIPHIIHDVVLCDARLR
jgi:hypothetical protein